MTIATTPLSGALGAEVHGLDPTLVDEADRAPLRAAFLEYGVLLARGLADMNRFVYLPRWDVGDLVVWDNWRTMRRLHRTTFAPAVVPGEIAA